jgi:hypothetical protein
MELTAVFGVLLVVFAGLGTGTFAWPMKLMRRFKFEQWFFVAMLVGLIIIPWAVTLLCCPNAIAAYRRVGAEALIKANVFGMAWGIGNVLGGICFVRIGVALTGGFLTGLGVSVGVIMPMILKGSGQFKDAPDVGSAAGLTVLLGVAVMLTAVVLVTLAGFGRDRVLQKVEKTSGGFLGGLIMAIVAGMICSGIGLSFVYGQGPIVREMKANGAGDIPAIIAVWAGALAAAALINVLYPAYLMTKNKSWNLLAQDWKEVAGSAIIGTQFITAVSLMGKGMLLLGVLGASIGFGIQQAMQLVGNQLLGFISGEWRGVYGSPRMKMYLAIALVIAASAILAYARSMT